MAELVHIKGFAELKRAIQTLPKNIQRNVLRASVNAGARLVRDQARINAPVMPLAVMGHQPPGTLKRSIVTAYIPEKSNAQQAMYYVTVRQGKKYRGQGKRQNKSQDAFYGAWVELGHHYVAPKPSGTNWKRHRHHQHATGVFVPPHPFLRPAYEAKKYQSVQAMCEYMLQRLPQEVQKARQS
jgi:HK97 gp10 family phage protein